MPDKRIHDRRNQDEGVCEQKAVERLIVLQLLRDDHPERWRQAELQRELADILPEEIEVALQDLAAQGVAHERGGYWWASLCAKQLNALGMIYV